VAVEDTVREPRSGGAVGAVSRALAERSLTRREVAAFSVVVLVVTAIVFGRYVHDGGFNDDDWVWANGFQHPFDPGYRQELHAFLVSRPAAALYLAPMYTLFNDQPTVHVVAAMLLAASMPVAFYAVVRTLGLERAHAAAISLLALVFPFANVTMFWPTAAIISLAVTLFFVGLLLSLRSLDEGRPVSWLHAAAIALWLLSLLDYEVTVLLMLFSVGVYAMRAGWRRAVRHAAFEWLFVFAGLAFIAGAKRHAENTYGGAIIVDAHTTLSHVKAMATQSFSLLWPVVFPFGMSSEQLQAANNQGVLDRVTGLWPLLPLAVVGVACVGAALARGERRREFHRWLAVTAAAGLGIVVAYAVFLPGQLGYTPLQQGINNRTNVVAAFGWVAIAYCVLILLGTLTLPARILARGGGVAVALVGSVAIACGYAAADRRDERAWARADNLSLSVIQAVHRSVPRIPDGSTLYLFLRRQETAPGVRVFVGRGDLAAAMMRAYRVKTLAALPLLTGSGTFGCGSHFVRFDTEQPDLVIAPARYGTALAVDLASGRSWRIVSAAACQAVARFYSAA
jgi:hypothetical protein